MVDIAQDTCDALLVVLDCMKNNETDSDHLVIVDDAIDYVKESADSGTTVPDREPTQEDVQKTLDFIDEYGQIIPSIRNMAIAVEREAEHEDGWIPSPPN